MEKNKPHYYDNDKTQGCSTMVAAILILVLICSFLWSCENNYERTVRESNEIVDEMIKRNESKAQREMDSLNSFYLGHE